MPNLFSNFSFGDFKWVCSQASFIVCPALGHSDPKCYSRNVALQNFLLFQPSVLAVNLSAIVMTTNMIIQIKNKYTAVGRKEMVIFFYLYLINVILEMFLVTNIIPLSTSLYKYFTAAYVGSSTACFGILLLNGFVGFQWTEDGTRASVWIFRVFSVLFFGAGYSIAIMTFTGVLGMGKENAFLLYITMFIFNIGALTIYVVLQVVLVLTTLHDMWALGDIFFGITTFIMGVGTISVFSPNICQLTSHYIDGMFLCSCFFLISVMMVYKYWDSITCEDLEYAVGTSDPIWHLKNSMNYPPKAVAVDLAPHEIRQQMGELLMERRGSNNTIDYNNTDDMISYDTRPFFKNDDFDDNEPLLEEKDLL